MNMDDQHGSWSAGVLQALLAWIAVCYHRCRNSIVPNSITSTIFQLELLATSVQSHTKSGDHPVMAY